MLEKIKDQENMIMMFFVVSLFIVGIYVIVCINLVDLIYFCILFYYFVKFLKIKINRE